MRTSIIVSSFVAAAALSTSAQAPQRAAMTIDALLDIRHPSRATWSPDGSQIAYVWDRGGVQNIYVVVPGAPPKAVTTFDSELIDGLTWNRDGSRLLFARSGDLWETALTGSAARRVWTTPEVESTIAMSPDGRRAAFERAGDLWIRELTSGAETRLTATTEIESTPVWSPDSVHIAFTSAAVTRRQDTPEFSGAKLSFNWVERATSDVGVVPAAGGAVTIIGRTPGAESSPKWVDARRLVFQRISPDLRMREIVAGDIAGGQPRTLVSDRDDKWWSPPASSRPEPNPSPDGEWIAFLSDRDGWDHLYVVRSAGGAPIPITTGAYEVRRPQWAPDSKRIAFDVNDGSNPGRRHLAFAQIDDARGYAKAGGVEAERGVGVPAQRDRGAGAPGVNNDKPGRVTLVTADRGADIDAIWRPDGRRLLFQHTDSRSSADLFVVDAAAHARPERLTDSLPLSIDRASLVEPQFVRYAAPDGQRVPAFLFVPPGMARDATHPAIVWIHGDGTNENYDGWHVERNYAVYYSVHQYLLQRGYVVLAVDYRGSIGYGRQWRQGHYRDLGGSDYDDVAAGVAFLRSTGYVDASRIGVWGLSYGGFMTLQALTRTPELFRCGIDVAGVDDWRDWHRDPDGPWINARMGSPQENTELYRRTAPIERVNDIVQPLLVLHGTADVNVPFYESVRLVDALVKAHKRVEFMMYPGELHYFWRAHVLRDAWQQVDRFFATHLAPPPRTTSSPQ